MKVDKNVRTSTTRYAMCIDCGKEWDDELNNNNPKNHHKKYNHTVHVQIIKMYYYNKEIES